jgi:hypothetical protein
MATPMVGTPISEDLCRKLRTLRDAFHRGRWQPDPIMVAWAAGVLKDAGELGLARDYERIARRLLPSYRKDLS